MNFQFPNIDEMKIEDAIVWYLKETNKVFSTKNRIAGTFSDEYKQALLQWKLELYRKALAERNSR
ncbi:hypothetical protein DFO73_11626 [Cytobacillus oceanisediminis]|uniref:Uncharacterized protein n=1 Tax=Cytobacillus oceanisediminis TaxID=665099 RepID=A0A2V2ZKN4_9BACI|nr:hypothetical protein [Cytobacillus oceanisediminis]PWW20212.1 hypothetical protein DFO73_11626 [Cytobacillus oceanisediminis]